MIKTLVSLTMVWGLTAGAAFAGSIRSFKGEVTAVDSNANAPGVSFTARDAEGHIKMFQISTLEYLDPGDRVVLKYYEGDVFPLLVKTIKFLRPNHSDQE